jgi:hypothetical protein
MVIFLGSKSKHLLSRKMNNEPANMFRLSQNMMIFHVTLHQFFDQQGFSTKITYKGFFRSGSIAQTLPPVVGYVGWLFKG